MSVLGATKMFKQPTVFILGAGASWHYGYPTGETLVQKVIEKATIALDYFEHSIKVGNSERPQFIVDTQGDEERLSTKWTKAAEECRKLKSGLEQVNPLVIDYYLGWNPDFQNIGRLLIAWVILECECYSSGKNINRRHQNSPIGSEPQDDWCRFIIHQLAINCKESKDLLLNKVSFVTFNYDISLENNLRNGLKHIQMFNGIDVTTFLGGSRVIHMYGKIRDVLAAAAQVDWGVKSQSVMQPTSTAAWSDYHMKMKTLLDVAYAASKGLRVIDPDDKGADDRETMIARAAIAEAKRILILGYGFDENNSDRLNLRDYLPSSERPARQAGRFHKSSRRKSNQ